MAIDKSNWPPGMNTYCEPLAALASKLKPKRILEVGLGYEGFSTTMWLENTDASVTTIDKQDWQKTAPKFKKEYPSRFTFIEGRSEDVMPTLKPKKFDLIFIDGLHTYEGCKADIKNAQALLAKGGVIVIDDYGVENGVVDVNDWKMVDGQYGVKQATDEAFAKGWKQVFTDIPFANGGQAYAQA